MRYRLPGILVILLVTMALLGAKAIALAQPAIPFPTVYSGAVTVAGAPAPDGLEIYAVIEDYRGFSVRTSEGRYEGLVVGPPRAEYVSKTIEFYIDGVKAREIDTFIGDFFREEELDLSFPYMPVAPTSTPSATSTPLPTAPQPTLYGGEATIGGAPAPDGTQIYARIGDYQSSSALVVQGRYEDLVVSPSEPEYKGKTVEFYTNGVRAYETDTFQGDVLRQEELDLTFPELPTTGEPGILLLWLALGLGGALSLVGGIWMLKLRTDRKG